LLLKAGILGIAEWRESLGNMGNMLTALSLSVNAHLLIAMKWETGLQDGTQSVEPSWSRNWGQGMLGSIRGRHVPSDYNLGIGSGFPRPSRGL
jgi:hypothetical protein